SLFKRETVETWLGEVEALLVRFVTDPARLLGEGIAQQDRRAASMPSQEPEAAPRNGSEAGAEERLGALWAEVLKLPAVGRTDNFFDLGGHSLLGLRLLTRIEKHFGRKLGIDALFSHPTVAELAEVLHVPEKPKPRDETIVAIQGAGTGV